MGLGKWSGKRHLPITPYEGSWVWQEGWRRKGLLKPANHTPQSCCDHASVETTGEQKWRKSN